MAVYQRGDARTVIAAIFQSPQRIEDERRRLAHANNADNAAHLTWFPLQLLTHDRRTARLVHLLAACHRKTVRRYVFGDHAASPGDRAIADCHRCHQRGIRSYEDTRTDLGSVLV